MFLKTHQLVIFVGTQLWPSEIFNSITLLDRYYESSYPREMMLDFDCSQNSYKQLYFWDVVTFKCNFRISVTLIYCFNDFFVARQTIWWRELQKNVHVAKRNKISEDEPKINCSIFCGYPISLSVAAILILTNKLLDTY